MDLKGKAAKWLKSNWSLVVATIALGLIAINDSLIGLIVYFLVVHVLCIAYAAGLFDDNFLTENEIKTLAKKDKTKGEGWISLTSLIAFYMINIVVLAARNHWYLLVVTVATIIFVSIHMADGLQRIRKYKKEMAK